MSKTIITDLLNHMCRLIGIPLAPNWQRFSRYPPIIIPKTAPGIAIPPTETEVETFGTHF